MREECNAIISARARGGAEAWVMVHVCCIPVCSNRSDRERNLSYFGLPLQNQRLLKLWIHQIGRTNLPVNGSTRICSRHFQNATGRKLRTDEAPSERLPKSVRAAPSRRSPRVRRPLVPMQPSQSSEAAATDVPNDANCDAAVNTDLVGALSLW